MDNRTLKDGDVKTACMQACPTSAIVFGNAHDQNSQITQIRKQNPGRLFYVIEQIHTLPNVNYLAKVRNTEELEYNEEHMGEHAAQNEEPGVPAEHKTEGGEAH
jgi:molybdopterin-containing oxidoreductase family iron-sulfur binding subunit